MTAIPRDRPVQIDRDADGPEADPLPDSFTAFPRSVSA
jgi:hypothetical protein